MISTWQMNQHEGWGAWAAAAALGPLVIAFSAIMGLTGIVLWFRERRKGRRLFAQLMATLLAGSVSIWFLAKILYLEIVRSF
jgi:hypothetical protein